MGMNHEPDIYIEDEDARMVAQSDSEAGAEFIDAYLGPMVGVFDSGRIVVPAEALHQLLVAAREHGLVVAS